MVYNGKAKSNENRILAVLFVGVLMGALDISIVSPALPAIKSFFQVDTRILIWVFNVYLLSYLVGTLPLWPNFRIAQGEGKFTY